LSTAEQALVRTAATHMVAIEALEAKFALGDGKMSEDDLRTLTQLTNSLRRLFTTLGMKRRSRDVTPTNPRDYLRSLGDQDDGVINGRAHRVRATQ
jgi:hypothetical protein